MCDHDQPHTHPHKHGRFDAGYLDRFKPIGRRTFLAGVGRSTVALLTEVNLARNVITIALGTTGLAACATPSNTQAPSQPATTPSPTAASTVAPTRSTTQAGQAMTGGIQYSRANFGDFVNAYVLVRGNEVALVDTGVVRMESVLDDVLKTVGRSWGDVKHVILTHYHEDHTGGMDYVMKSSTHAMAYAGQPDISHIQTDAKIQAITDGAEIFGLQIVGTPGHTAGHISVFDPVGSVFIAGDALNNIKNKLKGPDGSYSNDIPTAILSAQKISKLSFERAFFGHGEPIEAGASAAIAKLVSTL